VCTGQAPVEQLVEQAQLFAQRRWLACPTKCRVASWPMLWRSGASSSDQRVPLTDRPAGDLASAPRADALEVLEVAVLGLRP
jgi:hypothetical protein